MQKILLAISLVFIGVNSYAAELNIPNVLKTGDASNGSSLVATCAACHGNDGNSVNGPLSSVQRSAWFQQIRGARQFPVRGGFEYFCRCY